ncbi:hypothetical protein LSH36_951g01001, partial [Paralvinella palmiformis]
FFFNFIDISEVFRCDPDQRLSLPGFHEIKTRLRDMNVDYRGVALLIKKSLDIKIRDDLSVFIPHMFESLFVELA